MQNIEQLTRDLGAALQLSPAYVRVVAATERNEADEALQEKMQALGLARLRYQHEAAKSENTNKALMNAYEAEFQRVYDEIMENPNMAEYQAAKSDLEALVGRITGIITGCAQGEDPATYKPKSCCGGDCGGCGGCG